MRAIFRTVLVVFVLTAVLSFAQSPNVASLKSKAEAGDTAAQVALAHAYENGEGVAKNEDLAAKWYRAAADKGNAQAQSELGVMYRLGLGVQQDKEEAVKWYRKAAKQGFGPAMFNLATCFYNGDGVGISDRLAYAWFVLAKRAGSTEAAEAVTRMETELEPAKLVTAKYTLAEIVEKGSELPQPDPSFAFEIYVALADAHAGSGLVDEDARYEVGRMYAEGIGVPKDTSKALSYLHASHSRRSLWYLARMYRDGKGVPQDEKKSLSIVAELADQFRDVAARKELAGLYWDGGTVQRDYKRAVRYYGSVADGDADPLAFYRLGIASRDGLGTKKNVEDACFYFIIANTIGSPESGAAIRSGCTGDNLTKAKARAVTWSVSNVSRINAARDRQKQSTAQPKAPEAK